MQEQGICVMEHEDITRREEARLEYDNVCCLEGGFLMEGVGKAWDAKSTQEE